MNLPYSFKREPYSFDISRPSSISSVAATVFIVTADMSLKGRLEVPVVNFGCRPARLHLWSSYFPASRSLVRAVSCSTSAFRN